MIYPAFIMVSLVSVMVVIMIFIIPQLRTIFDDAGVALPVLTQVMLKISSFTQKYFAGVALAFAGLVVLTRMAAKKPAVAKLFEKIYFKAPVFGNLYRQVLMTRFTHTMSTLLAAGLPMIEGLKTTADVMNSPAYRESLSNVVHQVENGGSLSKAILSDKQYPAMVGHMIAIGEDSGNIDSILETVGLFYDKEVDNLTRNLSASLEPILMLAMGLGVGLVVASVITPMYGLVNAI
jgi:type IV pilus assembly protein PilC